MGAGISQQSRDVLQPLLHLCTTKAIDQYHNADVGDDGADDDGLG